MNLASNAGLDADTVLGIVSYTDRNAADVVFETPRELGQLTAGIPVAGSVSRVSTLHVNRAIVKRRLSRTQN